MKPWDSLADEDTGVLDRHFEAMWPIPVKVWLDGDRLVWSTKRDTHAYVGDRLIEDFRGVPLDEIRLERAPVPYVRASDGLLDEFLSLADDQTGEAILRFARRWGVLEVCEHGRPPRHGDRNSEPTRCLPRGAIGRGEAWALLASPWRSLSAAARALLRIAVAVEAGEPGSPADWRLADPVSLGSWWGIPIPWANEAQRWGTNAQDDRYWVSAALEPWLSGPQVTASFVWTDDDREWRLLPRHPEWHGLYGALGVALMLAIAQARELRICRDCRKLYSRNEVVRNYKYCTDCGIRASWKLSKRRQRNSRLNVPPKAGVIP